MFLLRLWEFKKNEQQRSFTEKVKLFAAKYHKRKIQGICTHGMLLLTQKLICICNAVNKKGKAGFVS